MKKKEETCLKMKLEADLYQSIKNCVFKNFKILLGFLD